MGEATKLSKILPRRVRIIFPTSVHQDPASIFGVGIFILKILFWGPLEDSQISARRRCRTSSQMLIPTWPLSHRTQQSNTFQAARSPLLRSKSTVCSNGFQPWGPEFHRRIGAQGSNSSRNSPTNWWHVKTTRTKFLKKKTVPTSWRHAKKNVHPLPRVYVILGLAIEYSAKAQDKRKSRKTLGEGPPPCFSWFVLVLSLGWQLNG